MLSIFGDFGDQKTHDHPQKNKKMPLKGFTAVFQPKKNNFEFFYNFRFSQRTFFLLVIFRSKAVTKYF